MAPDPAPTHVGVLSGPLTGRLWPYLRYLNPLGWCLTWRSGHFVYRFGGGSSELFAWLGGGFKRCVTLRTTRALVCYSGDDPRNPGIRGNKENFTFSGLSSIVENTNQF
ncbi:unnamed protein product [Brassica oleracea]